MTYPPNTLPVEFEPAKAYSSCLVASVVMAANYTEERPRFKVNEVIADLGKAGRDETKVQDLKEYLKGKGLDVLTLAGRLNHEPFVGMEYWLREGRYPVVCIINRLGTDAGFNHAVVVIGVERSQSVELADKVHYLDPSADRPLFTCSPEAFEAMWDRCRHAMLVVVKPPNGSAEDQEQGARVSPEVKP